MIGKGKSISHTKASIQYGWNQEKDAKVVFKQNLVGNTPEELTKEFQFIQSFNTNCNRNTFSFVLSPTIEDEEKLSANMLNKITSKFINELKLQNRQAVAFVHLDKNHKHIHLYVNRIDFKGEAYNDSYIGKKSQKVAEKVAKKLGLKTVQEVQLEKKNSTKQIRKIIYDFHKDCIKNDKPKTLNKYIDAMKKHQVIVVPSISKDNQLLGLKYNFKNQVFKGSAVHRDLSINKVALQMNYSANFQKIYDLNKGIKLLNKIVSLNPTLLINISKQLQKSISQNI